MTARNAAQFNTGRRSRIHAGPGTPSRSGPYIPRDGECVVGDRAPFCWSGCDDHHWQHHPDPLVEQLELDECGDDPTTDKAA